MKTETAQRIPFEIPSNQAEKACNAFMDLFLQRQAIGNHPDLEDEKWYPIFETTEAGLVFSHTHFEYWLSYSYAFVGAPFVFKTSQEAREFGKKNVALYNECFYKK